jgi:hypothetical protein
MPNTVAYFDIAIDGGSPSRVEFELFDDVVPKVRPVRFGVAVQLCT